MTQTTRFRFSASAIERLSCPDGTKSVEVSDADGVTGLRLAVTRSRKTFWFRFVLAGTKGAIRLGTFPALSVADARKLALAHRAQIEQGIDPRRQEEKIDLTFGEFAQSYLAYSRQHKRSHADDASKLRCWLLPAFSHLKLKELRRRHIEAYLTDLRKTHSPASVNRHLTLLSAMGRRAVALDYVERNWCAGIDRLKEDNKIERYLTPEQTTRLLAAVRHSQNPLLADIVAFLLFTGARKREALDAKWQDVDWRQKLWRIPKTKSGKVRHVPLSSGALKLLRELKEKSDPAIEHIFANPNTRRPFVSIFYSWDTARREAGLPELRIHDLRHSFASFLVNAGRSLYEVQELLGHADIRTTSRYAHLSRERLREAVEVVSMAD